MDTFGIVVRLEPKKVSGSISRILLDGDFDFEGVGTCDLVLFPSDGSRTREYSVSEGEVVDNRVGAANASGGAPESGDSRLASKVDTISSPGFEGIGGMKSWDIGGGELVSAFCWG